MPDEIMTEAELTTESTQEETAVETVERESEAISTESGDEIPIETTPDEIMTEEIATDVDTAEDTVAAALIELPRLLQRLRTDIFLNGYHKADPSRIA
jgi:hypothetical protein